MFAGYEIWVEQKARNYTINTQESVGKRLGKTMGSPSTAHVVVGRTNGEALVFAEHDRTKTDAEIALTEACCVYFCRVGSWPDFVVSGGAVRKISATGKAPPQCLGFMQRRQILLLSVVDIEKSAATN